MSTNAPVRRIGEQVGALRRVLYRLVARRLAPVSPRPFHQLQALRVIAAGQAATQRDLSERLLVDAPAASRLVELLVREGLVVRQRGSDRRCVELSVTAAGGAIASSFEEIISRMSRDARRHLGAGDFDTLMRLMAKAEAFFAAELGAPATKRATKRVTKRATTRATKRSTRARACAASSRRRRSR